MLNQVVGAFGLAVVGRVAYACYSQRNNEYVTTMPPIMPDALEPFRPYLPNILQNVKIPMDSFYMLGAIGSFGFLCIKSLDAFFKGNNHFAAIVLSATVFAVCAGEHHYLHFGEKTKFGQGGLNLARQFTQETQIFLTSFIKEDFSLSR